MRHLSALFVPLPFRTRIPVFVGRVPLLIRARSSHHMVTDGQTLPPFSTLSPSLPPLSPLQTQLFRAIFFGLRFPQGGTARDVTRMLGVADWHQSWRRRSPSKRLPQYKVHRYSSACGRCWVCFVLDPVSVHGPKPKHTQHLPQADE